MENSNPQNKSNKAIAYTQTKDGRWIPAQPLPYYRDTTPFLVKVWHTIVILASVFRKNQKAYLDNLEKRWDEKYMVPVEPYTDKDGKWRSW